MDFDYSFIATAIEKDKKVRLGLCLIQFNLPNNDQEKVNLYNLEFKSTTNFNTEYKFQTVKDNI